MGTEDTKNRAGGASEASGLRRGPRGEHDGPMNPHLGVWAFRFPGAQEAGLVDLFAVGRQTIRDPNYRWHGLERGDGPLYLFQYTWAGEGRLETPEGAWSLPRGWGFLAEIPSDHLYRIAPGADCWEQSFVLMRPRGAEALWSAARARLGPAGPFPVDAGPAAALETLVRAAAEGRIPDPFEASSLVYSFLLSLVRHALNPEDTHRPEAVLRAQRLLDEGWSRPWNLTEVARAVGLSPAHFHRTFRRHTGSTPLEWLTRRRMERAVELLVEGGPTVEAVARQLGFGDTGHFIRVFRRWTGTTPGALKAHPSAWRGSKIVLLPHRSSDGGPGENRVS